MGYPVLLTLTTSRSGTTFLYSVGSASFGEIARVDHETLEAREARSRHFFRCFDAQAQESALEDPIIGSFIRGVEEDSRRGPVLIFGNTLSHLAPVFVSVFGDRLRLLHLHRNPVIRAASQYVMTPSWWWDDIPPFEVDRQGDKVVPTDPAAVYKEYAARWADMTLFEKLMYQWLERHAQAMETRLQYPEIPFMEVRAEDMFSDPMRVREVFRFAGLESDDLIMKTETSRKNQTWQRSRETRPLGDRWRVYVDHPDVVELGKTLGHTFDEARLQEKMKRYDLPSGVLPWIRHKTRYWSFRHLVAEWMRARKLIPSGRPRKGLPPRSTLTWLGGLLRSLGPSR